MTTPHDVKQLITDCDDRTTTYLGTRTSQLGVERNIGIRDAHRVLHVLTVGPTGYGKSTMMLHAALQDAYKGYGLCIINPKGRTLSDDFLAKLPDDRVDDVIYINPDQEQVTPINVLEPHVTPEMSPAQVENQKEIIVADLIDLFKRYSENWGDRFGRILETLFRAHLTQNIHNDDNTTLLDVYECVVDDTRLTELIDATEDAVVREQLVRVKEDLGSYELEPLQRRLNDFVMNTAIRRVIAQPDSGFDFRNALRDSKIIVVDVQKGEVGNMVASLVGSIVLTKIWAAAQSRITIPEADRDPFYLYVDELQNFAGEGSNFTKILSEAREYKLGCWLATQYLHQLAPSMRRAVMNNARTKLVFNPADSEDVSRIAGMLTDVSKQDLADLGKFRAVIQTLGEQVHQDAATFTTYPPWDADHTDVDDLKQQAAHPGNSPAAEPGVTPSVGTGVNAGGDRHTALLEQAEQHFDAAGGVQVQVFYQDPGAAKPDGHITLPDGDIAHLEAEAATLSKPGKVLANLRRAADHDRECIFVVPQGNVQKLEDILADPVDRRGTTHDDETGTFDYYTGDGNPVTDVDTLRTAEYRIFEATDNGLIQHNSGREAECPELDDNDRDDLEAFCLYRSENGVCDILDQPCVLTDD